MTREKAIEQELKTRHETPHFNAGFVEGAHWADTHPDVSTGIAATHAYERGRKDAIDEACSWLRGNLTEHYADEPFAHKFGRPISGHIAFYEGIPLQFIKEFKEAMNPPTISKMETTGEKGGEK